MNDDDFNNKTNSVSSNKEKEKMENIENNLLKSSDESESLDTEKGQEQNNLRNDDNNNAVNGNDDEFSSSKSTNESDNLSANFNDIGNNLKQNNVDHSLDIAVLNEINKACKLAMNNISYLANMINDKEMRKELVAAYSQYSNIILKINQRFENYGEVPDEASIKLKLIGMSSIRAQTCKDKSNSHISEIMIQGTIMGIIKCTKILNAELELDEGTTELLKTFNDFQKENIQKFYKFL